MNSAENRVLAAMSAAADLAAREIPAAPPLRLPPESAPATRRGHAPRGWIRWLVPLAAAAAVIALAISLALIKDIQNGSMVPPNPSTTTGPGGVPRYYVALEQLAGQQGASLPRSGIVAGDSLTGGTLTTFAPPAGTTFASVTAAADDLTFVVFAVTSSTGSFSPKAKTTLTGRWYQVRLSPGAASPARLTPLPVKPVILLRDTSAEAGWAALGASFATALSGSGRELAVPEWVAPHGLAVKVFSVATGRLLHDWTTSDPSLHQEQQPSLMWIDGDRSLALLSSRSMSAVLSETAVREWPVAGSARGDLAAVGKVVWSLQNTSGSDTTLQNCLYEEPGGVHISADGKTFSCATSAATADGGEVKFYTFPLAASTTVTAKGRLDAQLRLRDNLGGQYLAQVLWASPSGGTLIGTWIRGVLTPVSSQGGSSARGAPGLSIGVISHGRFAPLHFPAGFTLIEGSGIPIAW
ncbi:MAG TPA: hypothetical protein VMI73_20180 [Trebonia sp.]|nr:hypothetical protein [Trebonia sp.]